MAGGGEEGAGAGSVSAEAGDTPRSADSEGESGRHGFPLGVLMATAAR